MLFLELTELCGDKVFYNMSLVTEFFATDNKESPVKATRLLFTQVINQDVNYADVQESPEEIYNLILKNSWNSFEIG